MMQKLKKSIGLNNPFRMAYHHIRWILAYFLYKNPSKNMIVIGVTGTNGKTTTTNIIARWLKELGEKVFMFSTVNYFIDDEEYINNTKMTSPSPFLLQEVLQRAKEKGCNIAIIETSSHSIFYNRNRWIDYDIVVLTNITQDHLDLHETMQNYVQTKLKLFKNLIISKRKKGIKKTAIINIESEYKDLFLNETYDTLYTYGKDNKASIKVENIVSTIDATKFNVKFAGWKLNIETPLRGTFNIYNILASIWVFLSLGHKPEAIEQALRATTWVPGRLEEVKNNEGYKIFIDYAHTPDALEQVLSTLKEIEWAGRVITVFWATGDRDKTKRPEMGKIVSDLSDVVILTQDDDYSEKTENIINDVTSGINRKQTEDFWVIVNRKEAIRNALLQAQKNDIILIAWKGDEHIMMTNAWPIKWHDKDITLELLQEIDDNKIL